MDKFSWWSIKPVNWCLPWYQNCRSITVLLMSPRQISITCFNWGTVTFTPSDLQICIKIGYSQLSTNLASKRTSLWSQPIREGGEAYKRGRGDYLPCQHVKVAPRSMGIWNPKQVDPRDSAKTDPSLHKLRIMDKNNKSFSVPVPHWLKLLRSSVGA
jgi:hypothetical protein